MSQDDSDSSSHVFEVETILAQRYNRQHARIEYLIKWATYDLYESSWEPKEALQQNADEALNDFRTICALREQGELAEFDIAEFEEKQALYQEAQRVTSSGSSVHNVDTVSRPSATFNSILIDSDSNESDTPLKKTTARKDYLSAELSDEEDDVPLKETTSIIKTPSRPLKILPEQQPAKPTYPTQFQRSVLPPATSIPAQQHKKPTALSKELSKIRSSLAAKARSEAQVISAVRARKALSPEVKRPGAPGSASLKRKLSQTGFEHAQIREEEQRDALQQPGIGDDFVYEQQSLATPQSPAVSSHHHEAKVSPTSVAVPRTSLELPWSVRAARQAISPDRSRMMHTWRVPLHTQPSASNSPNRPRTVQGRLPKSPEAAKRSQGVACSPATSSAPSKPIVNNMSQHREPLKSPVAAKQLPPDPADFQATSSAKLQEIHQWSESQPQDSLATAPYTSLSNSLREQTRSPRPGPRVVIKSQKPLLPQNSVDTQSPRHIESTSAVPSHQQSPTTTILQCPDLQLLCITDPDEGPVDFGRFQVMNLPPDSIFMEAPAPFHAADPGAVYEMTTRSTFSTQILVDALAKEGTRCCIAPLIPVPTTSDSIKKYCRRGVFLFEDPNFVGLLVNEKSGAFKAIRTLSKRLFYGMVAHPPTQYYFIFVTKSPVTMLPDHDVHRIGLMTELGEQAHIHSMYQALGPPLAAVDQGGVVHLEGPRDHPDVLAVMTFLEKRVKLRPHSSMLDSMLMAKAQQQTLFVLLHSSVFAPPYLMSACKGLAQAKSDRTVQFIVFGGTPSTTTADSSNENLALIQRGRSRGTKLYKCEFAGCSQTYTTKNGLKYHHNKFNHDENDQRDDFKPLKCYLCGKRFKSPNGVKYHMTHQHPAPSHQNALEACWSPQTSFSALAFPAAITHPGSPTLREKSACHILVEHHAADLTSLRALVKLLGTSRFNWHIYISPASLKTAGVLSYRQDVVAKETFEAAYEILGEKDDKDALYQPQSAEEASLLGQLVIEQWMQHGRIQILDNVDCAEAAPSWDPPQNASGRNVLLLRDAISMAAWKQVRDFQTHRHTLVLATYERSLETCSMAEGIEATTLVELGRSFARFQ
ncbi:hypothetical protein BCR37DRAFT_382299 [Protomyces lactucae-debilis]|uniref:Chromo domain-containing protein n=1 Tax=Protomyces lactucae-debilis TaxID=2754530 RepID=A0A1Y2F4P9_PROLT|nr:uncharacterized protein BCR37DRAFT_382299 [Protomyces lactucae-debilis]ORY78647.1 hypothetical protein BCR37DRAFT_382299 [Protomyces lactucae-debilis]